MGPLSLSLSFRRQLAQQAPGEPDFIQAPEPRCLFAVGSSHFHGPTFDRIRADDRVA
jgi:hypothetical protein